MSSNSASLTQNLIDAANRPAEVNVAGMGASRTHSLRDQLAVLNALSSAAAGRRAGIRRVPLVTGSPTGMRFNVRGDWCR